MKTQHTPGPWFYYVTPSGVRYKVHGPTVDYFICDVKGENDLANAHLIAAAPELLEACKELEMQLTVFSDMDVTNKNAVRDALQKAKQAISKATGKKEAI